MSDQQAVGSHERWAQLRFCVVGPLLACPPAPGQLHAQLARLAQRQWRHPITGEPVRFALSTIQRWYYAARSGADPVGVLRRKVRRDRGSQQAVSSQLGKALRLQHTEHPSWSYKLHLDNLAVLVALEPKLGPLPSYSSLRRYMIAHSLSKRRRLPSGARKGERRALERRDLREVRSYEAEYVSGLWHLDFHNGSLRILTGAAQWLKPTLLAILDDRSRLICHAQWYMDETAETLVHGLVQAFLKRGLPRALMSDNGSAMIATETRQGLGRLSVLHHRTLPYSPHQNGKQEVLWAQVEGRLLAMLEGHPDLTLALLNEATHAWIQMEYHRSVHSETNQTPLTRFLEGPTVSRPCPELSDLRLAFTASQMRTQRKSDGTISLEGRRFELPGRFRHLDRVQIRFATWDLSYVWLMDRSSGLPLARLYPLDKARNAEGVRRPLDPAPGAACPSEPPGIAPLLRHLMAEYAATGLPPAYIPKDPKEDP